MHGAIIGAAIKPARVQIDALSSIAKPSDDGRFRESMLAGQAAEKPVAAPVSAKVPIVAAPPPKAPTVAVDAVTKQVEAGVEVAAKPHEESRAAASEPAVVTKKVSPKEEPAAHDEPHVPAIARDVAQQAASPAPVPSVVPVPVLLQVPVQVPVALPLEAPAVVDDAAATGLKPAVTTSVVAKAGEAKKVEKTAVGTVSAAKSENVTAVVPIAEPAGEASPPAVKDSSTPVLMGTATTHGVHPEAAATGSVSLKPVEVASVSSRPLEASGAGTDIQTLVATPNVLEVGIASGTHGWLRVRAELGDLGEVTASVAAASTSAAEGLHKELPAISAYLAGERVTVSSLVVNALDKGADAQDAALNQGGGTQAGAQAGTSGSGQNTPSGKLSGGIAGASDSDLEASLDFGLESTNVATAVYGNGSGSWVNVRV